METLILDFIKMLGAWAGLAIIGWKAHNAIQAVQDKRIQDRDDQAKILVNIIRENTEAKQNMACAINNLTDSINTILGHLLGRKRA